MTASERSYVGLAKQTAAGTPNTTDANFEYILFTEGGIGPQNVNVPLDQEVGGGAMLRSMIKAGVTSAGVFTLIPRPLTVGYFLLGALGQAAAPVQKETTTAWEHVFSLPTDQFAAPYYTFRSAPGNMWGEQFQDCRVALFGLNWKAADYIRGQAAIQGGLPTPLATDGEDWGAAAKVDKGPQFIAPKTTIELPDLGTGTNVKCLNGSFVAGLNIPLDEQWITGAYSPDAFDINSRMFSLSMALKIVDDDLYEKANYDPNKAGAWVADIFREGRVSVKFVSDQLAGVAYPYSLEVEANGQSANSGNVVWTATPVGMRAGRQVVMNVTGTFLASPTADEPITVRLINQKTTQYGVYA
jgi:hypothetical protein